MNPTVGCVKDVSLSAW